MAFGKEILITEADLEAARARGYLLGKEAAETLAAVELAALRQQLKAAQERELAIVMTLQDSETVAQLFHENYERLAPAYGWKTQSRSARPWQDVPDANKGVMVATCEAVARALLAKGGFYATGSVREGG